MKVLDLFSGIGGFSLGLERAGFETIAFCELEDYPVSILNKHWPNVPVHRDIRKLDGRQYRGTARLVCGGFPCQPFSVAGKQAGEEDDRHLWPEMFRIIREVRPDYVIGENVAGFIAMALDDVLFDLESEGYRCEVFVLPACAVGAVHRRDRVWIVAHTNGRGWDAQPLSGSVSAGRKDNTNTVQSSKHGNGGIVAHARHAEPQGRNQAERDNQGSSETGIQTGSESTSPCSDVTDTQGERCREAGSDIERPETRPTRDCSQDATHSEHSGRDSTENRQGDTQGNDSDATGQDSIEQSQGRSCAGDATNTSGQGLQGKPITGSSCSNGQEPSNEQPAGLGCIEPFRPIPAPTQPPVRHRDDGLPDNVARLKALGNAVVPQIPELIGRYIMRLENGMD